MKKYLLTILLTLLAAASASATSFIKDVMLIGGTENQVNSLKASLTGQGWTVIGKDLNAGAGGDYIYLLYKSESNDDDINLGYVTDFYISTQSDTAPDTRTVNGRTYYLVPYQGGSDFVNSKGDLNRGAGGDYIHLYYTKEVFSNNRVVSSISFNDTQTGALGANGGSTGYDLNKGADGDYIYMHVTTTTAVALTSVQIGDGTSGAYYLPLIMSRSYSLSQQLYTAEEIGTAGTIKALSFYYRDYNNQPFTKNHIRVYLKHTASSSLSGITTEVVSENNGYTQVYDGAFSATGEGWIDLQLDTPYEYDGNNNLIVCCYDYGSNAYTGAQTFSVHNAPGKAWSYGSDVSIDLGNGYTSMYLELRNDIRIDILPNPYRNPINLTVTPFTENTASVSWSAPSGSTPAISGYKWQYKKSDESAWSTLTSTTGTTADLTGLSAFTEYMFRVKVIYNTGESSFSILRFVTAVELPYDCGFENGMPGWSQVDHNHYYNVDLTGISEEAKHDGSYGYMFRCYDENPIPQYLISPGLPGDTPILVSFYFRNFASSSFERFQVGYSTTTRDIDAFEWGEEITEQSTEWTRYENYFPVGTQYVAVKYISNLYQLFLDDFEFTAYSPYERPTGLSVSELKDQSVTLQWDELYYASGYAYQYRQLNGSNWSAETSVNGTSATISNLSPNTTYDFRLKALFSGTDASNYVTIRFITEGPMESLPHFQDFENGMGGWRFLGGNGRTGITTSEQHGGSYGFEFDEGSPNAQTLRSPLLEGSAPKVVSFFFKIYSEQTGESIYTGLQSSFQVGWSTTTNRLEDFVVAPEVKANSIFWTKYTLVLPEDVKYVHIMVKDHQPWLYVDDISIDTFEDKIIASYGYFYGKMRYLASFYNKTSDYELPEGAVAYTVAQDGDELVFLRIGDRDSRVIPAGTPVIVVADNESSDTGNTKVLAMTLLSTADVSARPGNILQASEYPVAVSNGKIGDKTVYVLGIKDWVPGFYQFDGDEIPAGKAYILK
ncbi:MAG: fibronectin type III domain-containing protein [Bacteroidales bacterium]|nr:fibronectin type III domain-containing protein [Bacteroidales bacterium]